MTLISASPGPKSARISSAMEAEHVISASDSLASHDSSACTCRLIGPDTPRVSAGLGGVHGGNHWHIEELGQGDGRVGGQASRGRAPHQAPSRRVAFSPAGSSRVPSPASRPSCRAELELVRVVGGCDARPLVDLVGGGMAGRIGVEGPADSTTTSWPAGSRAVANW